jgi:hypothetical protein
MASKTSNIATTTFVVTFSLFMVEAIMHYNIGRKENDPNYKGFLPPAQSMIKLGAVVGVFSVLNGVIINEMTNK